MNIATVFVDDQSHTMEFHAVALKAGNSRYWITPEGDNIKIVVQHENAVMSLTTEGDVTAILGVFLKQAPKAGDGVRVLVGPNAGQLGWIASVIDEDHYAIRFGGSTNDVTYNITEFEEI